MKRTTAELAMQAATCRMNRDFKGLNLARKELRKRLGQTRVKRVEDQAMRRLQARQA